jgi:hypothetical protein
VRGSPDPAHGLTEGLRIHRRTRRLETCGRPTWSGRETRPQHGGRTMRPARPSRFWVCARDLDGPVVLSILSKQPHLLKLPRPLGEGWGEGAFSCAILQHMTPRRLRWPHEGRGFWGGVCAEIVVPRFDPASLNRLVGRQWAVLKCEITSQKKRKSDTSITEKTQFRSSLTAFWVFGQCPILRPIHVRFASTSFWA